MQDTPRGFVLGDSWDQQIRSSARAQPLGLLAYAAAACAMSPGAHRAQSGRSRQPSHVYAVAGADMVSPPPFWRVFYMCCGALSAVLSAVVLSLRERSTATVS